MKPALTAILSLSLLFQGVAPDFKGELEEAKALYEQGRMGRAVAKLQALLVRLSDPETPEARSIKEEAYLYSGLAYVALDDPEGARGAFASLIRMAPDRNLDPSVYAPKVVALFEEARREAAAAPPPVATQAAAHPGTPIRPEAEKPAHGGSRLGWAVVGGAAGAGSVAAVNALKSSTTTTSVPPVTTTTTAPSPVEVDARMNGLKQGTFSCSQSLSLSIDVINNSGVLLRVDGFDLSMNTTSAECITHRPAIDGTVGLDVLPGARVQIRQADLAGDLCASPGRVPGCSWRAVIVVSTGRGPFEDDLVFSTIP